MIDYQAAVEIVDTYMKAMTEEDHDTVLAMYAEDATVEDPVGSEVKVGKAAIAEFYNGVKGADLICTRTGPVRFANSELVFPFECVMRSPEGGMKLEIIDHFVINDEGLVTAMRAFWGPETSSPLA